MARNSRQQVRACLPKFLAVCPLSCATAVSAQHLSETQQAIVERKAAAVETNHANAEIAPPVASDTLAGLVGVLSPGRMVANYLDDCPRSPSAGGCHEAQHAGC